MDVILGAFGSASGGLFVHLLLDYGTEQQGNDHPPSTPQLVQQIQLGPSPPSSPYSIAYGTNNPRRRGLIMLPSGKMLPNFGHTPRLVLSAYNVRQLAAAKTIDTDLVICPAVHGRLFRLFFEGGSWWMATNRDCQPVRRRWRHSMITQFQSAIHQDISIFCQGLPKGQVSFFSVTDGWQAVVFLGGVPVKGGGEWDATAPVVCSGCDAVTVLGTGLPSSLVRAYSDGALYTRAEGKPARRHRVFDGVFVFNKRTLMGCRFSPPDGVFLAPLLKNVLDVVEFACLRAIQLEIPAKNWRTSQDATWASGFRERLCAFGLQRHGHMDTNLEQITALVLDIRWVIAWMGFVASMDEREWSTTLHPQMQYLYMVLQHESVKQEPLLVAQRLIQTPAYSQHMARALAFCIQNSQGY